MIRYNFRLFILFTVTIIFFVLLKNGHIFDVGIAFRKALVPEGAINSLLQPPSNISDEYQKLLVENVSLRSLAEENKQLKNLLNFRQEHNYNLVLANIISRDSANPSMMLISAGTDHGIEVGQPVVVNQGIMIGRVVEVGPDYAQVRLLTDKFSKLAVKIGEADSIAGLLSGSLGLSMNLTYVPQDREIKKGDLVLTAETGTAIPAGLLVGQIENIDFSQEELFKKAAVAPLLDYNTLSTVAVVSSL
ncbi:MAG: rod shape-determining protein MreC [Parcubacteria group bacterium]|nr:MAG: rod shape-determining protein MreC [Parcubacteria group bacterium]